LAEWRGGPTALEPVGTVEKKSLRQILLLI
jgi:hypothetical protein